MDCPHCKKFIKVTPNDLSFKDYMILWSVSGIICLLLFTFFSL